VLVLGKHTTGKHATSFFYRVQSPKKMVQEKCRFRSNSNLKNSVLEHNHDTSVIIVLDEREIHTRTYTRTHSLTQAQSLSLSQIYKHTHTRTHSLTHSNTPNHSLSVAHTHTHSHTHTHIHTHTRTHTHTHINMLRYETAIQRCDSHFLIRIKHRFCVYCSR